MAYLYYVNRNGCGHLDHADTITKGVWLSLNKSAGREIIDLGLEVALSLFKENKGPMGHVRSGITPGSGPGPPFFGIPPPAPEVRFP